MYAIMVSRGLEPLDYYPDPLYQSIEKAMEKVAYLESYREKNKMKPVTYLVKNLEPEEEAEHQRQWKRFCAALD